VTDALADAGRVAGRVFVGARAGQLLFSALMVANDRRRFTRFRTQLAVWAALTTESVWLSRRILSAGRYEDPAGMWVDTVASASALLVSARGLSAGAAPWTKNVVIGAAIGASSATRRRDAVAAVSTLCASGLLVGLGKRGRDAAVAGFGLAFNDAVSWAGVSAASRVYLKAHRNYARLRDQADGLAIERSAAAAAQTERGRQHEVLHRVTIDALRKIAAAGDMSAVRAVARAEASRLRYALRAEGRLPQGLDEVLTELADEMAAAGFAVELVSAELDSDLDTAGIAAVRSALASALSAAHELGSARRAVVRARSDGGDIRITIRDHGCGFDPASNGPYSERVDAITATLATIGGDLAVWSEPGEGVRLDLRVPSADSGNDEADSSPALRIEPGAAPRMPVPAAGTRIQFRELDPAETRRADRTLLAGVLAWRATGLMTGVAALLAAGPRHRSRRIAVAQLLVAAGESAWFAARAARRDRWVDPFGSTVDAATGTALLAVSQWNLEPDYRVTWLNWVPWSFAENVICGQAMAGHPFAARVGGAAVVAGAQLQQSPSIGDRIANAAAHAGFFSVASAFASHIRSGAVRLDAAQGAAVREGELLAQTQERAVQLRLLHDSAVQTLEAVAAGRRTDLEEIREQSAREADELERELRRTREEPASFEEMLLDVVDEQRAMGLQVEVELCPAPALPFEAARALCGACREALTNVAKHSGQARASVQVRVHGARIMVEVRDDGVGFDTAATAGGFGTVNSIRQRMADAGGRAEIVAAPGRGTAVTASWPA
jgi:signal transduction histidine kinase